MFRYVETEPQPVIFRALEAAHYSAAAEQKKCNLYGNARRLVTTPSVGNGVAFRLCANAMFRTFSEVVGERDDVSSQRLGRIHVINLSGVSHLKYVGRQTDGGMDTVRFMNIRTVTRFV